MQEAGEHLDLQYEKGPYGPYARNLRHVLNHIEGHFIHGYSDGEDRPDVPLRLQPRAVDQAELFLSDKDNTRQRFERVVSLIEGFETTFGMELLATVHWVKTKEAVATAEEAIEKVHAWNSRKPQTNV